MTISSSNDRAPAQATGGARRVAVVGGGVSGLVCAGLLRGAGMR